MFVFTFLFPLTLNKPHGHKKTNITDLFLNSFNDLIYSTFQQILHSESLWVKETLLKMSQASKDFTVRSNSLFSSR